MDTVGAFVGPLLATLFLLEFPGDLRAVLWVAVVPAFLAVAILAFGVREPEGNRPARALRSPIHVLDLRRFSRSFWWLVALAAGVGLARFSEAFLILKASAAGLPVALVPLVFVAMNLVYAAAAYPAGALSDRIGRLGLLRVGMALLAGADLVLAFGDGAGWLILGVGLWGMHLGCSQGLLAALIADTTPEERLGTAFGLFNLVSGVATLLASVAAGGLWDRYGARATFLAGAGVASLVLIVLATRGKSSLSPDPLKCKGQAP
jgi:MFS family permease